MDSQNKGRGNDEQWLGDDDFLEFTQNDPVGARNLRLTLEKLAEGGAGETTQEMAREVLSGRIGLRQAVTVPAYSEALVQGMQPFKEKWEELSDSEREELAAQGQRDYEQQERELREERAAEERKRNGGNPPRHSGGWTL
ncbi:hypothetical protein MTQ01_00355 [Streptomyces sp. XM4193]|uniref:hypothetical protein n=1 Tax=Streptomyces sp. XM4193 TaxID=2929782 RepID=UPI001FFBEDB0|nr:hypothetical protein [Streptomyces sp. XM4193]MCK1794503.1 hypothetical protein [Streptomyces sp. XM4193]